MRTPARYSAEAMESPSRISTLRPSNSMDGIDLVRYRVAFDGEPSAAAREVKPALRLPAACILRQPEPLVVRFRWSGGIVHCAHFATEPEFGERARPAVRTMDSQGHSASI